MRGPARARPAIFDRSYQAACKTGRDIVSDAMTEPDSVTEYDNELAVEDDPAFGIIDLIDDDGVRPHGSVAVQHDQYLADALEDEFPLLASDTAIR